MESCSETTRRSKPPSWRGRRPRRRRGGRGGRSRWRRRAPAARLLVDNCCSECFGNKICLCSRLDAWETAGRRNYRGEAGEGSAESKDGSNEPSLRYSRAAAALLMQCCIHRHLRLPPPSLAEKNGEPWLAKRDLADRSVALSDCSHPSRFARSSRTSVSRSARITSDSTQERYS